MTLKIHVNNFCIPLQNDFLVSVFDGSKGFWEQTELVTCNGNNCTPTRDVFIQCCSFSPCGRYFAVCLCKDLIIYSISSWTILCSVKTERRGISVRFFPKSEVVLLAEKSGNVKFFKILDDKLEKINFVLGHNSMLMEALVTDDERFIITCDRDEKIRVTNYPNIYNIQCYCLGHTQFISSIDLLQSDKRILLSTSGDGSVRFWNIKTGEELSKYTEEASVVIANACKSSFFMKITSHYIYKDESLVAGLKYNSNSITLLKVFGNVNNGIRVHLFNIINLSSAPWDIEFWHDNIVCLLPEKNSPLHLYSWDGSMKKCDDFKGISHYLISKWDVLLRSWQVKLEALPLLAQSKKDNDSSHILEIKKSKCI